MKIHESRKCDGGLFDCDSPSLGLAMIWRSQEECDEAKVAQEWSPMHMLCSGTKMSNLMPCSLT